MKKRYIIPEINVIELKNESSLLAGSTTVSVGDRDGSFDNEGGDAVINARPSSGSIWD